MQSEGDDSFVSISLEGSECEICLQDTGEHLTTCDICARHLTRHLTRGPIQEGFNQIPDVVHAETRGHSACFRKFHKLARRLGRNGGSPKHLDEAGASAAAVRSNASSGAKAEYAGSSSLGDYRQPFTPAPRDPPGGDSTITFQRTEREHWLKFNTNNLGSELLLENIRNWVHVSRSNPGSRRGSPVFSGTGSRPLLDQERCRSDPELDISSSAQELRRSYAKYLYGSRREDEENEVKEKPFARLKQNVNNTSEEPLERVSQTLEKYCLTTQVPEDSHAVAEEIHVVPEQHDAKSNDKSCLRSNQQYLEPMSGSTLEQRHQLVRDNGTRAEQFGILNNRTDANISDKDNSSGLMDSRIVRDSETKRGSRKCDIDNQTESEKVRKIRNETCREIGLCNDSDIPVIETVKESERVKDIDSMKDQTGLNKDLRRNENDRSALNINAPCETQVEEGLRAADWWRDVGRIDNDQLYMMSSEQLRTHVQCLRRAVNDAGSQLVQLLQEKDVTGSEVTSRHVTIKKLVQRQTNLHH